MNQHYRNGLERQHGGTFLGLVIGLVMGLAIAVGVALVITGTPAPFVDRSNGQDKVSEISKIEDPNRTMYPRESRTREEPAPAPRPAASAPAEPVASAAATQPAPAPAVRAPADDGQSVYYLQVGAYKTWNDAEGAKAKLALMGFQTKISEHKNDDGTVFRVRMGPFAQEAAVNKTRGSLSDNGIETMVVKMAKS